LPAQDSNEVPPPAPPFLAPIPDVTACTVKVTSQLPDGKPPEGIRSVKQMVNIKSGGTRVLICFWTDGSQTQTWFVNGYCIEKTQGGGQIQVTPLSGAADSRNTDFPGFEWLSLANYSGLENKNGKRCYKFKAEVKQTGQRVTVDYLAYIDVKTKLPVSWDVGPSHFEMTAVETTVPPAMPAAFAASLKAYRDAEAVPKSYAKKPAF